MATAMPMIFDAHLDLALNAVEFRRDLSLSLGELRARQTAEGVAAIGTPTVTLDELRRGGVGVVVSTLLARSKPWASSSPVSTVLMRDWPTRDMVYAVARGQLAWYQLMEQRGQLRIITSSAQLQPPAEAGAPPGVIITLEGADPIVEPEQLHHWHELGLRTLMLAHIGVSGYAHGTPSGEGGDPREIDGPLTALGRALLPRMAKLGMPLDLTHLSDTSFFEAIEAFRGRIYSSHAGCRALCGHRRNHSDDMLRRIVERGGVVGVPMYNTFLGEGDRAAVSLDTVVDHVDWICQLAGDADHVGIGSDLDGGFGVEHVPRELDSIADLHLLGGALRERGFTADDAAKILGGNWLRFFGETLP